MAICFSNEPDWHPARSPGSLAMRPSLIAVTAPQHLAGQSWLHQDAHVMIRPNYL
jgi:hypothetical protein